MIFSTPRRLHPPPSDVGHAWHWDNGVFIATAEEKQNKCWRLKDRDENRKFASKVEENIEDIKEWNQLEELLLDTAKSVLGQTTGKGAYNDKEAWWWNDEVQKAVKEKRLKFKQYQQSRCDEDKEEFGEANKRAKREGMPTTEPVFAFRQLQEKCREKNKDLHTVFVDLENSGVARGPRGPCPPNGW